MAQLTSRHQAILHPIDPVYDRFSRVLLLGTMPSAASRRGQFYYMHPQNRFWKVLAALFDDDCGKTQQERRAFLLRHRIALWDVLRSCDIVGASDASIRNPVPNDLSVIQSEADIRAVFSTGSKAAELYRRHCMTDPAALPIRTLPSTSPANARYRVEDLVAAYRVILPYLPESGSEK